MPVYSRSEFQNVCGIEGNKLRSYISRGKVIVSESGFIDSNIEPNKSFYLKWSAKKGTVTSLEELNIIHEELTKPVKTIPQEVKHSKAQEMSQARGELWELELEQKQINLKKSKADLELSEIKKQKMLGELAPITLIEPVISALIHGVTVETKNYIEDIFRQLVKEFNIPPEESARYKGLMIKGLNLANDKAVTVAKKSIKSIADNYSEVRAAGERI